jgi:ferredoxin-thioredoxin reductase catalytic subunit/rubredoxin
MTSDPLDIANEEAEALFLKMDKDARANGYFLNPDRAFTLDLMRGLTANKNRYGYMACPCRLADGKREQDLDIICPCDYRDTDVEAYGSCYCALYVSKDIAEGKAKPRPIPERRAPDPADRPQAKKTGAPAGGFDGLAYPVWRCNVCGYLAARDTPPGVCPVCKAEKDRFELFIPGGKRN